jgi:hypothetical protein
MKPEVRDIVFFQKGTDLAVFALKSVDVVTKIALGVEVTVVPIEMDTSIDLEDGIKRHFWAVTEFPPKLLARLTVSNHAVRGSSRYRVSQPDDNKALQLLRLAEEKARDILFADQTVLAT